MSGSISSRRLVDLPASDREDDEDEDEDGNISDQGAVDFE